MIQKISWMEIWSFFKNNKEGLVLGYFIGWIIGKYFLEGFVDLNSVAQNTNSLIDVFNSAKSGTIELARTKIAHAAGAFGALIGAFVDSHYQEGWIARGIFNNKFYCCRQFE